MVQDGATGGGKKKKNRNKNKKNKQQQQQDENNSQPELEQQTTSETTLEVVSQSATKQHGGKFVQIIFRLFKNFKSTFLRTFDRILIAAYAIKI